MSKRKKIKVLYSNDKNTRWKYVEIHLPRNRQLQGPNQWPSFSQRCKTTNKLTLKQPDCEKDFNQYYFSCTHNALPSVENQQYCENYWTFCRYMLEQKLGVQDASIYRGGRKYYANTFCQRYKLMGTLYCPTLQTTSLRQD
uniref:Uncharacterized protein n=1 Tax=Romanomermis culicivorax TaxID=13658 RepID=A0A915HFI8_ROMCU